MRVRCDAVGVSVSALSLCVCVCVVELSVLVLTTVVSALSLCAHRGAIGVSVSALWFIGAGQLTLLLFYVWLPVEEDAEGGQATGGGVNGDMQ